MEDFRYVARHPLAGLEAQFLLLPAATLGIALLLDLPAPTMAALMPVAACPGGTLALLGATWAVAPRTELAATERRIKVKRCGKTMRREGVVFLRGGTAALIVL